MRILDRHVMGRFLANFLILFSLLFVFAVSVDVIVQAERYLDAARAAVKAGRAWNVPTGVAMLLLDFHGPRVFQFYQYMLGLVSVGAMGFTLAQMHRTRELTAIMAAGISLRRVAGALLLAAAFLNVLQIINQEAVLPRLAPRLVRDHSDLLSPGTQRYPLPLTRDGAGNLIHARSFDPETSVLEGVLIIDRDAGGEARRRITAERATWDAELGGWRLEQGTAIVRGTLTQEGAALPETTFLQPISFFATDLHPHAIVVKRFRLYSQMLGITQLKMLEEQGGVEPGMVTQLRLNRFAAPLANLLVLALAIPFFLLREPRVLLQQSVKAAAVAVPAMLGALVFLTVPFKDVPAAMVVALPVAVLLPVSAWRLAYLRT